MKTGLLLFTSPKGRNSFLSRKPGGSFRLNLWTWLPPLRKQFAKAKVEVRTSYEKWYAKAFPFDKMIPGMLHPEMIENTLKIVNEAIKDKFQVNLIINHRASGNVPLITQKVADRLHSEKQQGLF